MVGDGRVRYEERQWVPWWIYPAIFFSLAAFFAVLLAVIVAISGKSGSVRSTGAILVAISAVVAAAPAFGRARIRLEGTALRVGRCSIPLDDVNELRIVDGDELKTIRRRLLSSLDPALAGTGGTVFGQLGQVFGQLGIALTLIAHKSRLDGVQSLRWQHPALLIETPHCRTPTWIVGTRRPDELLTAVRSVAEQAQTASGYEGLDAFPTSFAGT